MEHILENGYKILNHTEPMSIDEIRELYDGYWVYVVNAEFCEDGRLIKGIPVVIGDRAYAGASDGIYSKFDLPEYGEYSEVVMLYVDFVSSIGF